MEEWRNKARREELSASRRAAGDAPPFGHSAIPPSPPAIPRTVKGLSLVSLFNDFASEMVYPLLPAFVTGTLGGSATTLGALDGAAELAAAATKWRSGVLADRPGWRKPLIVIGYFSAVLIRPVMSVAAAAWQVVAFRVVDRVGKGLRTPARDAVIADVTPAPIRGRAFGFHRAADHFGSVPGALLAAFLLDQAVDLRTVLLWSAVPGIVAGLVLVVVLRGVDGGGTEDREDKEDGEDKGDTAAKAVRVPVPTSVSSATSADRLGGPLAVLALLALCRLPEALLLLRLQDVGLAVALVPLTWAGLHVIRTAVAYGGGWLSDSLGPSRTILIGGVLFALGAAAFSLVSSPVWGVAVFLALGSATALSESAERSLVARLSPRRTGRGFGVYHAVVGLAALPAATGFGALYQFAGGPGALAVSAAAMLLAAACWAFAGPRPPG